MDGVENVGLLVVAVDSLADCDLTDAGEIQPFADPERVFHVAAQSGCVVHQDRIERALGGGRGSHHAAERGAIEAASAHGLVHVDVLVVHSKTVDRGPLAAFPDLVCGGELALLIGGNSCVDGSAIQLFEPRSSDFSFRSFSTKSYTRIGTTTLSMNPFSFGVNCVASGGFP